LDQKPVLPTAGLVSPASPIQPVQASALRRSFIGKDGLRAGWGLLIFMAMLVGCAFTARFIVHKLLPNLANTAQAGAELMGKPPFLLINESVQFLIVLLITWIMSRIERRPSSVYGLGGSRKLRHFLAGLAWGIVCLSILTFTLMKGGFLVIDSRTLFGNDIILYGAVWLIGFLLVGMFEEYLLRGYLQYTLSRGMAGFYQWAFKTRHSTVLGFWTSAVFFSILFGLGHGNNPGESPIGLLSAGLAGLVFCFSLWRTGSLWWAIGFHAAWDWSQSFLYGVADSGLVIQHHLLVTHPVGKPILSGGTTGPEGSIFILAALALASLIIVFTLPKARYVAGAIAGHSVQPAQPASAAV
jgi:uncharacterized protein